MIERDWRNYSGKEEACALVEEVNYLIHQLVGDYVKYHTRKGYIEINKQSANFVVTMKLERKKVTK